MSELIIDESNFHDYFFDTRTHGPKKGQVLARYTAMADFIDGDVKRYIVEMLKNNPKGADMVTQLMKYHIHAADKDCTELPLQLAKDLSAGMTVDEVCAKEYRFQLELFYWTEDQYIPADDPHWERISVTRAEWALAAMDAQRLTDLVECDSLIEKND